MSILVVVACLAATGAAQSEGAGAESKHPELQALVTAQFGEAFTVYEEGAASLFTADLNGDGVEDAVIIARMSNPLLDQKEFNYKVVDPHHGYFGFGDPEVTLQFGTMPGRPSLALLVIHGAGAEAWRAERPREKFALVNTPFEKLAVGRTMYRKRVRPALLTEEGGQMSAALFWDGRRYRWEPSFEPN